MATPWPYDPAIGEAICERLSSGESLGEILESTPEYPRRSTVNKWEHNSPEFAEMYARARERCGDAYFDKISKVYSREPRFINNEGSAEHQAVGTRYDTGDIQWMRLQCDMLRWQAAKLGPKRYADTKAVAVEATDAEGKQVGIEITFKEPKTGN